MGTDKTIIEPPEEVIKQLHEDFSDNKVKLYKVGWDKIPSSFIGPTLIHPNVLKKSKFVAVGLSACPADGRQYMYLAPGRIDEANGEIVTDLDPIVMVYDLKLGTPAPSGVTCFHSNFEDRTESVGLEVRISDFREDIQREGEEVSFEKAPKRFTEAMNYSAKRYRNTFDKKHRGSKLYRKILDKRYRRNR